MYDAKILIRKVAYSIALFWFRGRLGKGTLVYRFNHMHQFAGHKQKTKLPPERRRREAMAGNFVDWKFGIPFTKNRLLFRLLYKLYYSTWDIDFNVEAFFNQFKPDLVILSYIQKQNIRAYSIAARKHNIPALGIIGSWDKLTTKGPLCPGIKHFIVGSKIMQRELEKYHDVSKEKVNIIGWPKMDFFKQKGTIHSRDSFMKFLNIPIKRRLLLFGGNTPRLGPHEPEITEYLANQIKKGSYNSPCTLIIRPHPKDNQWKNRFGWLHHPPDIIVQPPEYNHLEYFTNLLCHVNILLASQGSICLDAIAMNTCVINIAFDGSNTVKFYESVRRWYEIDHYLPIIKRRATTLVESFEEMDKAIINYLQDPDKHAEGRKSVMQDQLEPFDGKASERLVSIIVQEAQKKFIKTTTAKNSLKKFLSN